MENTNYIALTRQSGLAREMTVIANNIANAATTGFRQEGIVFSEFVARTGTGPSVSIAAARIKTDSFEQGALTRTGGSFDLAVEGVGFFQVSDGTETYLTRSGAFSVDREGTLVTQNGDRVLDPGGTEIFIPPDAVTVHIAPDGSMSAEGRPLGQIGVFQPLPDARLIRKDGVAFRVTGDVEPIEETRVLQGFLEQSNVDPISQVARMIEVQRAYEMGQSFLDAENERVRSALQTMIR